MRRVLKMSFPSNHGCHDRQQEWVWTDVFMDRFSRYNQIKMYPDDDKHTSFRTPLGVYCYTVMPIGLKIAGETYQRVINTIFLRSYTQNSGMLRRRYCSEQPYQSDHIADLKAIFIIMRAHQLKMNPTKSFLGVASGKFLEFVITSKGIHLDPEKVHAV